MHKYLIILFCLIFFSIIASPLGKFVLINQQNEIPEESVTENRALATLPKFNYKLLDPYPDGFSTWWDDHFGFRNSLISLHHHIKTDWLKISPVPEAVIFGSDDWYFMKGKSYQCYTGLNKFSEQELREGKIELEKRAAFAKSKGLTYYIFIAPLKHRIYPDKLPGNIVRQTDSIQAEQLISLSKKIDGLEVIDLAPRLKKQRKNGDIYLKTDNHWNERGGFYAYQIMVDELIKRGVKIPAAFEETDYEVDSALGDGGALALFLKKHADLKDYYIKYELKQPIKVSIDTNEIFEIPPKFWVPDQYEQRFITERAGVNLKLLMFRESFGRDVFPHLKYHFAYNTIIFDAWQYNLNPEIIEAEQPDVLVMLILERNLKCLMTGGSCEGNF